MNPRVSWLASIAADARLSNIDVRLAVAIAGEADDHGRLKSSMSLLAPYAHISSRRMLPHLQRLAECGHIKAVDLSRQGRFHVEIPPAVDAGAPKIEKPFREIVGAVIAAVDTPTANGRQRMSIYVEAEDEMVKMTVPRNGAEAIAAALARARE